MRAQERGPDYRVVAAWSAFLLFIGNEILAFGDTTGTGETHLTADSIVS
jgi:hypothetical protein